MEQVEPHTSREIIFFWLFILLIAYISISYAIKITMKKCFPFFRIDQMRFFIVQQRRMLVNDAQGN